MIVKVLDDSRVASRFWNEKYSFWKDDTVVNRRLKVRTFENTQCSHTWSSPEKQHVENFPSTLEGRVASLSKVEELNTVIWLEPEMLSPAAMYFRLGDTARQVTTIAACTGSLTRIR